MLLCCAGNNRCTQALLVPNIVALPSSLLQAEEDAALAAALGRAGLGGAYDARGRGRITSLLQDSANKALNYEEDLAQAMALSIMPMDQLAGAAEEACAVSAAMGE